MEIFLVDPKEFIILVPLLFCTYYTSLSQLHIGSNDDLYFTDT